MLMTLDFLPRGIMKEHSGAGTSRHAALLNLNGGTHDHQCRAVVSRFTRWKIYHNCLRLLYKSRSDAWCSLLLPRHQLHIMFRFATLVVALSALGSAVSSTPISGNATLTRRVTHEGRGTWYNVGLGACGYTDTNSDPIVAISHLIYGSGGNCGQWMQITNTANGISQYGLTHDRCAGCGQYDIDLSPSLFQSLGADLSAGVIEVEWHYMAKGWSP